MDRRLSGDEGSLQRKYADPKQEFDKHGGAFIEEKEEGV